MRNEQPRGIITVFLLLMGVNLLLAWQVNQLAAALKWIDHTDEVIAQTYF